MQTNLQLALFISLVGFSLVLVAILILWLMILLIGKISEKLSNQIKEIQAISTDIETKRQIAVAAVVVAIAYENDEGMHKFPIPPTAFVSAWQAVMRANTLKRRGQGK